MKHIKTIALSSLLFSWVVIADASMQEESLQDRQYLARYNASARVKLKKESGCPDFSLDGSFLYYYASEDGLDLANSASLIQTGLGGATIAATSNSKSLMQNSAYKPGFLVGFGINWNEWTSNAKYIWIRQTTTTKNAPITPDPDTGTGVWFFNNWFQQVSPSGQTMATDDLSSKWHLAMDIGDLTMGRPFYEGKYLTVSPFFGVRGAWIRQKLNISMDVPSLLVSSIATDPIHSYNSSHSWALGPRTGFESSWVLGKGFSIQGKGGVSLLFTQYTNVHHSEEVASSSSSPSTLSIKLSDVNCVRPELDLGLGFNWGLI